MSNSKHLLSYCGVAFNTELRTTKAPKGHETVLTNRAMRRFAKKNPGIVHNVVIQTHITPPTGKGELA